MSTVVGVRFIDTIGQNLGRVIALPYWQDRLIGSYTTRSFAASDSQFADIRHPIKIDQAPTNELFRGANVKDAENGGATLANLAALHRAGRQFVSYTFEANMGLARQAVPGGPFWVANWNLSEAQALDYLAVHHDVVAVQWASPTSNPNMVVPGSNGQTIKGLNVDLSVGRKDFWLPAPHPVPKPESDAKGIWRARLEHNMDDETWRITPEPGQNVKLGQKMLSDHALVTVDQHTGVWHVKGTPR